MALVLMLHDLIVWLWRRPPVLPADDRPVVHLIPLHAPGGRHTLHPERCARLRPPPEPPRAPLYVEPYWDLPLLRHRPADIPF